jgi:hypothetical protein
MGDYQVTQADLDCARNPKCDIQPVLDKMAAEGNTLASYLSLDIDNANVVPTSMQGTDWTSYLVPLGLILGGVIFVTGMIKGR